MAEVSGARFQVSVIPSILMTVSPDRFSRTRSPPVPESFSIARDDILGAVLCGGKSTRFGSGKTHFEFEGETLVERSVRTIEPLVAEVCLAIGDATRSGWPNVRLVPDRISGIGPMGGLHVLLHDLRHDWLLVLPVDVPFMTTELLSSLIEDARRGDKAIVATDEPGRLHPLCGLYNKSILPAIEEAVARKEYGITRLLAGMHNVRHVTFPEVNLRNVNRPGDLL